jgi:hypothetical protein
MAPRRAGPIPAPTPAPPYATAPRHHTGQNCGSPSAGSAGKQSVHARRESRTTTSDTITARAGDTNFQPRPPHERQSFTLVTLATR